MARSVFEIFLSSTSKDLQAHRDKVREMIDRMRQTTIRMETFGAKPDKPFDTCRKEVQECDALIVIVGHRYGWIPSRQEEGDGVKSITWWEVEWAMGSKKPVFAFLADPAAAWSTEREQDRLTSAKTQKEFVEIGRAVQHLQEFRAFLNRETTRELFASVDDLGGKVATSLHDWLLEQSVAAARSVYQTEETTLPALPKSVPGQGTRSELDFLYWQEQAHLLSAQRLSQGAEPVRIALIAGKANTEHPALAGAAIQQFDARHPPEPSEPDDYTTALAGLLVGNAQAPLYRGVSPDSPLFILNVLSEMRTSYIGDMLAALDAAIREGVKVVCLPLGSSTQSTVGRVAFQRAAELGVVVVCSAGNSGNDKPFYPAAYPRVISVAALDYYGRLAEFSSFGDWVTLGAPGVDLPIAIGNDRYDRRSGTSFACGVVSGAIALMLSANPNLAPDRVKEILQTVGQPTLGGAGAAGQGQLRALDAFEAVRAAVK